jgi:enediyne biosynthesis protein E4
MTGNRIARVLLGIIFVGLIVTPLVIRRISARRDPNRAGFDSAVALARHGFYLAGSV